MGGIVPDALGSKNRSPQLKRPKPSAQVVVIKKLWPPQGPTQPQPTVEPKLPRAQLVRMGL